jgi:hypothetical protein
MMSNKSRIWLYEREQRQMIDKKLSELALGDKISEPVFTKEGHLLLSKGTIVSYELLSKLKKHNANYFKTLETLSIANKPKDLIDEEVMTASIRGVKSVFDQALLQEHKGVKTSIPDEQISFVVSVVESPNGNTLSIRRSLVYCHKFDGFR